MIVSWFFFILLIGTTLTTAEVKRCTPDGFTLQRLGTCVRTTIFEESCRSSTAEISASKDCSDFDGSWCCYESADLINKTVELATSSVPSVIPNTTSGQLDNSSRSSSALPSDKMSATSSESSQAAVNSNQQTECSPDDLQSLPKLGICIQDEDLDFCTQLDLEFTMAKDCPTSKESWCCYNQDPAKKPRVGVRPVAETTVAPISTTPAFNTTIKSHSEAVDNASPATLVVVKSALDIITKSASDNSSTATSVAPVPTLSATRTAASVATLAPVKRVDLSVNDMAAPSTTTATLDTSTKSTTIVSDNITSASTKVSSSGTKIIFCTPNSGPSLHKRGICARTDNLKGLCARSNLDITTSDDCSQFQGSWCCYDPEVLIKEVLHSAATEAARKSSDTAQPAILASGNSLLPVKMTVKDSQMRDVIIKAMSILTPAVPKVALHRNHISDREKDHHRDRDRSHDRERNRGESYHREEYRDRNYKHNEDKEYDEEDRERDHERRRGHSDHDHEGRERDHGREEHQNRNRYHYNNGDSNKPAYQASSYAISPLTALYHAAPYFIKARELLPNV